MTDTGILYATGAANNTSYGNKNWSSVTNVIGSGGFYASMSGGLGTLTSHYMEYAYSPGLAAGDTIVGMEFSFTRYCDASSSGSTSSLKALINGTFGTEKATGDTWPTTGAYSSTYGSPTDMWGFSAGSITGSSTFKMCVAGDLSDKHDTLYIGNAQLTIYYTPAPLVVVKPRIVFFG